MIRIPRVGMAKVSSLGEKIGEKAVETANKSEGFNPDKRMDVKIESVGENKAAHFDPDKRIESDSNKSIDKVDKTERLKECFDQYFDDLKKDSDYSETLQEPNIDYSELRSVSVKEHEELRRQFNGEKKPLIKEWERANNMEWPKYSEDIYSSNGILIRKIGDHYDAHHIIPLGIGGSNMVDNITPLHVNIHYDHKGIHAKDSAYDKLNQAVKEMGQ